MEREILKHFSFCVSIVLLFVCSSSFSQQLDPSIVGMAPGGRAEKNKDDGMETSRYVKRPKPAIKPKKFRTVANAHDDTTLHDPSPSDAQGPVVAPLPTLTEENSHFKTDNVPQPDPHVSEAESSGVGQRMRDLVLGGDFELIDRYRSFLDTEDIRKNIFEWTMGATYFYNSSSSPYFFRNYIASSPGAFLGLNLWITPFLGIDANYRFSILSEIKDSPTIDIYSPVSHSWFEIGVKFRRFFGISLNSSSLTFGLKYADYSMSVQPSSLSRLSQHTRGPEAEIEISVPSSKNYAWNLGFIAQPFMHHEEMVKANDLSSGTGNQTVGFGGSLGGEYRFSRQSRTFFKFTTIWYKSQFSGQTRATDPVTGGNPNGTPVNNVFYFIDFGLRLGR